MEIITPGDKNKKETAVSRCSKCGCEYSYQKSDVKFGKISFFDKENEYYTVCPTCGKKNHSSITGSIFAYWRT